MKHAPATKKGLRRRLIIFTIDYVLGMCFMLGLLFALCGFVTLIMG